MQDSHGSQGSRPRSAGHHRSHRRFPVVPLAGLAVLLVLGLVFGVAFLRQPGTKPEASLNLTSNPEAVKPTDSAPTTSPTASPTTRKPKAKAKKSHKPVGTTSPAARKRVPVKTTTHQPRPRKTTTKPSTGSGGGTFASKVLTLTNAERAKAGCGALKINAALTRAAQDHSADMAAKNYFSHDSQDGTNPFDRMTAAGYKWSGAAENIAMGQQTAESVMDSWMNSPGHKANILNCGYKEIGIGYAVGNGSPYWTQDFGSPL